MKTLTYITLIILIGILSGCSGEVEIRYGNQPIETEPEPQTTIRMVEKEDTNSTDLEIFTVYGHEYISTHSGELIHSENCPNTIHR